MTIGLDRWDLRRLAETKFVDAQLLLEHGRMASAYYLAGYAIELGLKACIARQFVAETIPDKRFVLDIHTHEFEKLIAAAGLKAELNAKQDADPVFQGYWGTAGDWSVEKRYSFAEGIEAQLLVEAVGDPQNGIMAWIRTFW